MAAAAAPPWVILDRVARVPLDDEDDYPEDIFVSLAAPLRLSTLTVPWRRHPVPRKHDMYPYILAADAAVLLLHINRSPAIGVDLHPDPKGTLAVVRGFVPVHIPSAIAIANRPQPDVPGRGVGSLKHVGLLSLPGGGATDWIIAELEVVNKRRAKLFCFHEGATKWAEKNMPAPDMPAGRAYGGIRHFHDVVAHDGELWWVNLDWGLLSCDPFERYPYLRFTALPAEIDRADRHSSVGVEKDRLVRVSNGELRYVEMTRAKTDGLKKKIRVVMWTPDADDSDPVRRWSRTYGTSLGDIWEWDSYRESGMPEEVPALAAVHPSNPDVLYFFLTNYIFGVNVPQGRVTEFINEGYDVNLDARGRPPPPLSWRYVLAWALPPSLSQELDNLDAPAEE